MKELALFLCLRNVVIPGLSWQLQEREQENREVWTLGVSQGCGGPLNSTAAIHLIRKFRNMVSPVGDQQHFTEAIF